MTQSEMKIAHEELMKNLNNIKHETQKALLERDKVKNELQMVKFEYETQLKNRRENALRNFRGELAKPDPNDLNDFLTRHNIYSKPKQGANDLDSLSILEGKNQKNFEFFTKNGNKPPTNNTLKFEGTSKFVPINYLEKIGADQKEMTMRNLAKMDFPGADTQGNKKNNYFIIDDDQIFANQRSMEMDKIRDERPNTQQNMRESRNFMKKMQNGREGGSIFQNLGGTLLKNEPNDPLEDTIDRLINKYNKGGNILDSDDGTGNDIIDRLAVNGKFSSAPHISNGPLYDKNLGNFGGKSEANINVFGNVNDDDGSSGHNYGLKINKFAKGTEKNFFDRKDTPQFADTGRGGDLSGGGMGLGLDFGTKKLDGLADRNDQRLKFLDKIEENGLQNTNGSTDFAKLDALLQQYMN